MLCENHIMKVQLYGKIGAFVTIRKSKDEGMKGREGVIVREGGCKAPPAPTEEEEGGDRGPL